MPYEGAILLPGEHLAMSGDFFFFFGLFLGVFLGPLPRHMEVPRLGVDRRCSHWPTPEPQQLGI